MSIDYLIGFKEKPKDLAPFLAERQFALDSTREREGGLASYTYQAFVPKKSAQGVRLVYYDGLDTDDARLWQKISPEIPIAATASVTTDKGRNWFDEKQQRSIARAIRDDYDALVFDPQAARFVHDVGKVYEIEHLTYRVDHPSWFASQWSSTAVAIYSGKSAEPTRIIERPAAWGDNWAWNLCDEGVYLRRTD